MENHNTLPPFFKRGTKPQIKLILMAILSIVIMIVDARFDYLKVAREGLSLVVDPVQQFGRIPIVLVEQGSEFFITQSKLKAENEVLRQHQIIMSSQIQRYHALLIENEHLKKLQHTQQSRNEPVLLAEVVHTGRDPFRHKIIVDKGEQHSVKLGAAVIDQNGLIGQVTAVYPLSSEITLLTDKDHIVPVEVMRNSLRAVVKGNGEDALLDIPFMAINADIQNGDVLVTSGIDGTYPKGIPVAKVTQIERHAADTFARVRCTPTGAIGRYRYVLILFVDEDDKKRKASLTPVVEESEKPAKKKMKGKPVSEEN